MSLKTFVNMADVRARIKVLRPKFTRTFAVPLVASPRSKRYSLVGTAFDYLLRFELQRRAPHAVAGAWVAEQALDCLCKTWLSDKGPTTVYIDLRQNVDRASYPTPEEVVRHCRQLAVDARAAVQAYLRLVGGADADLIAWDMLIDFKTTKKIEMDAGDLDKTLGYFLLARKCPDMPAINRIGLYYARRAHLLSFDTSVWLSHPDFPEIETWFFRRAGELRSTARRVVS